MITINERLADKEVIESLRRTISRMKESRYMSVFFKDTDGSIKEVLAAETVNRDVLVQNIADAEIALADYDALVNETTEDDAPAETEVPVQPETPAPVEAAPVIEEPVTAPAPAADAPAEAPVEAPAITSEQNTAPETAPAPVSPNIVDLQ